MTAPIYHVTIFLALIALCGCSQNQLEHQSDAFNRASATTISEQTLLNAVRSSLDLPMSFTKLQGYTAGGVAKGTLAPTSVVKAPRILGLGPTLDVSPGVETIQYVEVNNSGALAHLNKNLGYQDIHRYIVQGYDPWLIATILVEYVAIHDKLLTAVQAEAKRQCARPPNPVVKMPLR